MSQRSQTLLTIAKNIRTLRKAQGLSQEELAYRANLHRTYIGAVERGERNITIKSLEKIAIALKTNLKNLLE